MLRPAKPELEAWRHGWQERRKVDEPRPFDPIWTKLVRSRRVEAKPLKQGALEVVNVAETTSRWIALFNIIGVAVAKVWQ
ncbi:hypothetical protein BXP70_28675 [Hymenobacter crusticola]|uniref:Uncharacterized protein n=1 Tax=Hymenobacter crusticola TaxID=1770526 RepID=A0A243W5C2_9BACT|nr:hypothetical protein BXP70_28675 [Hymenobacter crusticola]